MTSLAVQAPAGPSPTAATTPRAVVGDTPDGAA